MLLGKISFFMVLSFSFTNMTCFSVCSGFILCSLVRYCASLMAHMVKNLPVMWETQVQFLGQEDALEKGMTNQPTSVFLPGEFYGQSTLVGYSPWSHKESDMTKQLILLLFSLRYNTLHIVLLI